MAFTKLTDDLLTIESLADQPNRSSGLSASELKALFDKNAKTIKDYINDVFLAEIGGAEGAPNVGIFPSATFTDCSTVQEALEFLYEQIIGVTLEALVDGSVTTSKLHRVSGSEAVTTDTIRNFAVTEDKIGNGAVTADKLEDGAVTESKISIGAVTKAKIATLCIDGDLIANGAISKDKIGSLEVTNDKIENKTIDLTTKVKNALNIENGGTGSSTAASALVNLGAQSKHIAVAKTLEAGVTSWTVSDSNIKANSTLLVSPAPASFGAWRNNGIRMTGQGNGTATFSADAAPTETVTANIVILN